MDRYAVFGNPIAHSKSPDIHHRFAEQTQQSLSYEKCLVELEGFSEFAKAFQTQGGRGCNITVPFKEEAYRWVDQLDPLAQSAGAVNTIAFKDGEALGYNTDGLGLVRDLTVNHQLELGDKNILVLGAGGAVRGVIEPLMQCNPASVTIANRTVSKAGLLAELFDPLGHIVACGFEQLAGQQYDLIINGTAAGLSGELPPLPKGILRPGGTTYDMVYAQEPTVFVKWGEANGAAKALDGLGMLVEQAAEAFAIWRGVRPQTQDIIEQMKAA